MFAILPFVGLTFAISLAAFILIATVPGADTPESMVGLPFWLVAVWGPSLSAIILTAGNGHLGPFLGRAFQFHTIPIEVWGLILAPLVILIIFMGRTGDIGALAVGPGPVIALVAFNLILGPLGEEFGWRGYMQDRLSGEFGWLGASLVVGVVWYLWHLPLWLVDSPQKEVPVLLFGIHVMAYAVIIGAAHQISGGSLAPAILLHLVFNVSAGWAVLAGTVDTARWFQISAIPYLIIAMGLAAYVARAYPCEWTPD